MDPEKHQYQRVAQWNKSTRPKAERWSVKGPVRLMRLCVLAILLPGLLMAIPLYLRYHVYSEHLVPLAMSDMRMIDKKISTTWCQGQNVTSNVTFNAYLLAARPTKQATPKIVSLTREMELSDDMKEYWGFYLLEGSTVTVSSCASRHGASLIAIRGHHHLHQCAYIGDDSSEEEEELEEIRRQNKDKPVTAPPSSPVASNEEKKKLSNRQRLLKFRTGVQFKGDATDSVNEDTVIRKELDLKEIVDDFNMEQFKEHRAKTRVNKPPSKVLSSEPTPLLPNSRELFKAAIDKFHNYRNQGKSVDEVRKNVGNEGIEWLRKIVEEYNDTSSAEISVEGRQKRHREMTQQLNFHDETDNNAQEEGVVPIPEHDEIHGSINGTSANDTSNSEFWSSFSSSEERLLECEGLILSQPLKPSSLCERTSTPEQFHTAVQQHRITYTVPGNGYYFFVFSSENEIERNFIHAELELQKIQYNVSSAVASCKNSSGSCQLPLSFFSDDRLVLELPAASDDSQWDTEFLIVSTCQPRTALYVACIIAVPILILLCSY